MEHSGEPPVEMSKWMLAHASGRKPYTVAETFALNREREAFRTKLLAHWNATATATSIGRPVDAILCPIAPTLAPPHDTTKWWGYSSYWQVLYDDIFSLYLTNDLPSGICSITLPWYSQQGISPKKSPPLPPTKNSFQHATPPSSSFVRNGHSIRMRMHPFPCSW